MSAYTTEGFAKTRVRSDWTPEKEKQLVKLIREKLLRGKFKETKPQRDRERWKWKLDQIDVSKVDWTKSATEIAQELQIPRNLVYQLAKTKGKGFSRDRRQRWDLDQIDLSKVDWTKRYHEIAEELSIPLYMVPKLYRTRFPGQRKYCMTTEPADRPGWQKYKQWDWTKTDSELSRENDLTRERIRQIRQGLGLPPSQGHRLADWPNIDWSRSDEEIAEEYGCSIKTAYLYRRTFAPDTCPQSALSAERERACLSITPKEWMTLTQKQILARLKKISPGANRGWTEFWKKKHNYNKKALFIEGYKGVDWENMTPREVAAKTGKKLQTVIAYARNHNLPFKRTTRWYEQKLDWSKMTVAEVARKMNKTRTTVYRRFQYNNIPFKRVKGER